MVRFIYKPRSGSKVTSLQLHRGMAALEWANGSLHVVGGVELSLQAAEPKRWWRNAAVEASVRVAAACGGLSYDECGTVGVIVPRHAAWAAWQWLKAACPFGLAVTPNEDRAMLARLVTAGAAGLRLEWSDLQTREDETSPGTLVPYQVRLRPDADVLVVTPTMSGGEPVPGSWDVNAGGDPGYAPTMAVVRVPAAWGAPVRVHGGVLMTHEPVAEATGVVVE